MFAVLYTLNIYLNDFLKMEKKIEYTFKKHEQTKFVFSTMRVRHAFGVKRSSIWATTAMRQQLNVEWDSIDSPQQSKVFSQILVICNGQGSYYQQDKREKWEWTVDSGRIQPNTAVEPNLRLPESKMEWEKVAKVTKWRCEAPCQ